MPSAKVTAKGFLKKVYKASKADMIAARTPDDKLVEMYRRMKKA